jgi:hypothetical protein
MSQDIPFEPQVDDARWVRFEESYTTREHLMRLYQGLRGHAVADATDWQKLEAELAALPEEVDDGSWPIERGFQAIVARLPHLAPAAGEGFAGMRQTFSWGLVRLGWQGEADRQEYQDILAAMLKDHRSDSLPYRQDGERAITNGWWADAVVDLSRAVELYRYDYLAHLQLARVMWFEQHDWPSALQHFGLAAKYADTTDASEPQRYYATLAYAHISLLHRLEVLSGPENSVAANRQALAASDRALQLVLTLSLAFQEQILNLLQAADTEDARRTMEAAVSADENLLVFLEHGPDLADLEVVSTFVKDWRDTRAEVLQSAIDIAEQARKVVSEYALDITQTQQVLLNLRRHASSTEVTPTTVAHEAVRSVAEALTAAEKTLEHQVDAFHERYQAQIDLVAEKTLEHEALLTKAPFIVQSEYFGSTKGLFGSACLDPGRLLMPVTLILDLVMLPFLVAENLTQRSQKETELAAEQQASAEELEHEREKEQEAATSLAQASERYQAFLTGAEPLRQSIAALLRGSLAP